MNATPRFNDPKHWRERGEEARIIAEGMSNAWARQSMLKVAGNYEKMAALAMARQWETTQ